MSIALFGLAAAAAAVDPDIIVTASREPIRIEDTAAAVTIIDQARIEALGAPLAADLLRLTPGISVQGSGSQGSFTQIRIRGAEANHSLVFIDGIQFNDPAAGNEARFQTFAADGLGQIEVVRGPQSALWGSEAIGGVIALDTPDPLGGTRLSATGEYGSLDFRRAAFAGSAGSDTAGVSATASWLKSDGVDIFGGGNGDKDGFENITASLKAVARPGSDGELGIVGRYIRADNEFDGTPPPFFVRADTLDETRTETEAVRAWARLGVAADAPWSLKVEGQYLHSESRNRDGATPLNAYRGDRFRVSGQAVRRFAVGGTKHELIGAVEHEGEEFSTANQAIFFVPDQRRTRERTAFVGEFRSDWGAILTTDFAVRHDRFNRFADETTIRASALARLGGGVAVFASYGEGIAQPTFFDLYGFDPNSFIGNPNLKPERSRGIEAGLRYDSARFSASVSGFSNRLRDEILTVFDTSFNSTTINATGKSPRKGIEAQAEFRPVEGLRIGGNYSYIDADEQRAAGGARLREVRRPKHSGNLFADWSAGRITVGGSLAYVGKRDDTDFDLFVPVKLNDYLLANLRVAYRITDAVEVYGRVENAGGADYQDIFAYETPGRTFYGGLRFRLP
jgi:vitamin B12 transporter